MQVGVDEPRHDDVVGERVVDAQVTAELRTQVAQVPGGNDSIATDRDGFDDRL